MMNISMKHLSMIKRNQQGIISLMMTMVMMIVITLIVIGLAQMSRREQQQSLDNQLSSQAYYAAETGVNDAISAINKNGGSFPSSNNCNPSIGAISLNTTGDISAPNNVGYTCVIVQDAGTVTGNNSHPNVWPLQLSGGGALPVNDIHISWTSSSNGAPITSCPSAAQVNANGTTGVFTNAGIWNNPVNPCPYGVLRVDLVPAPGDSVTRATLTGGTMTAFFVPTSVAGAGSVVFSTNPGVHPAVCSSAGDCHVDINGLGASKYYIRTMQIYNSGGKVSVSPSAGSFTGAQAIIDSTGKAQDVLRRLRVNVNINPGNANGNATQALVSGDSVCKRWVIYDTGTQHPDGPLDECNP